MNRPRGPQRGGGSGGRDQRSGVPTQPPPQHQTAAQHFVGVPPPFPLSMWHAGQQHQQQHQHHPPQPQPQQPSLGVGAPRPFQSPPEVSVPYPNPHMIAFVPATGQTMSQPERSSKQTQPYHNANINTSEAYDPEAPILKLPQPSRGAPALQQVVRHPTPPAEGPSSTQQWQHAAKPVHQQQQTLQHQHPQQASLPQQQWLASAASGGGPGPGSHLYQQPGPPSQQQQQQPHPQQPLHKPHPPPVPSAPPQQPHARDRGGPPRPSAAGPQHNSSSSQRSNKRSRDSSAKDDARYSRYSPEEVEPVHGKSQQHRHQRQQAPPPPQQQQQQQHRAQGSKQQQGSGKDEGVWAAYFKDASAGSPGSAAGTRLMDDSSVSSAITASGVGVAATDVPPPHGYSPSMLMIGDLEVRLPRLYIPSDFTCVQNTWTETNTLKEEVFRMLMTPVRISIDPTPDPSRVSSNQRSSAETGSLPMRFNARVLMVLGFEEGSGSIDLYQHLTFLLGRRKANLLLPGGGWVPSLDGGDPQGDENVLIRTAIRTVQAMTGLDLSVCRKWQRLIEIRYHRPEEVVNGKQYPEQEEVTVVFICDLWRIKAWANQPSIQQAVDGIIKNMSDSVVTMMLQTKLATRGSQATVVPPRGNMREQLLPIMVEEALTSAPLDPAAASSPLIVQPPSPEPGQEDKSIFLEVRSFAEILAYTANDRNERSFEVFLAAETLLCLLGRHHGSILFHALTNDSVYDTLQRGVYTGRSNAANVLSSESLNRIVALYIAGPRQVPQEEDLLDLFFAFRFLDRYATGSLSRAHLERVLQNLSVPTLSRKDIIRLVDRVMNDPSSPASSATSAPPTTLDYASLMRPVLSRLLFSTV